jgi:hypothetical protein
MPVNITVDLAMRQVDPTVELTASTGWSQQWYEGVLLWSPNFLPGSRFRRRALAVRRRAGGALAVRLPRHSVARLALAPQASGPHAEAAQL